MHTCKNKETLLSFKLSQVRVPAIHLQSKVLMHSFHLKRTGQNFRLHEEIQRSGSEISRVEL